MRVLVLAIATLLLSSCATMHYSKTLPRELQGKLISEWKGPDQFIFRPDTKNPLTFTRHNKDKITPGLIYTDEGSIPRLSGHSEDTPWGYAPAFIVHDWLFHVKHCQLPGHEKFTVEEAAWVMSEVMKTIMEKEGVDRMTLYTMFESVRSPMAEGLWESGKCIQPPRSLFDSEPIMQYLIEFP